MKNINNRRRFIKNTTIAGLGLGLAANVYGVDQGQGKVPKGKRIGMIGLDTGHSVAFTKSLNDPMADDKYNGYKVVAAYPNGTENIKEWKDRIPEFTREVKNQGVEIVNSIDELLNKVDVVILTCIDGNRHFEQSLPVFKAGKPLFIDKPFAGSLSDAYSIAKAAKEYNVPMFSSSSLRYMDGIRDIAEGIIGKVVGTDAYSPAHLEEHHPDLFWYGVHGVEILFSLMGTGCKSVKRTHLEGTDYVVGVWEDNRIGTYRGIRTGKGGYGATVFGENGIKTLNNYNGYNPLLVKITEFFDSGIIPVPIEETLEVFAFMQAAEESKKRGGVSVKIKSVIEDAKS